MKEFLQNKNHILLIDDSEVDLFINSKTIRAAGYKNEILEFSNPLSALDFIKSGNKSDTQSLIFLDINMPEMDGFAFLEEFNKIKSEIKKNCKVIVLSSSEEAVDLELIKKNNSVNLYMKKPLNIQQLQEINL